MRRHLAYLKYVLLHKYHVFRAGLLLKVPLWQLIVHDRSKFKRDEWFPYAETFYKTDGSKKYEESVSFFTAWNLHQKRNKHHWQYWQVKMDRGEVIPLEMPEKYVREMVADWSGAGRLIAGTANPTAWFDSKSDQLREELHTRTFILAMNLVVNTEWSRLK